MVVFELSMPNIGSWNNKWTGNNKKHIRCKKECEVPKDLIGKNFYYSWSDGWTACITVRKVNCKEARKLLKLSSGFCGYDWMISSIIQNGCITINNDKFGRSKKI